MQICKMRAFGVHVTQQQFIQVKQKKGLIFSCGGGQTREKVIQRGCGDSVLGEIQNPAGHSPEQLQAREYALKKYLKLLHLPSGRLDFSSFFQNIKHYIKHCFLRIFSFLHT